MKKFLVTLMGVVMFLGLSAPVLAADFAADVERDALNVETLEVKRDTAKIQANTARTEAENMDREAAAAEARGDDEVAARFRDAANAYRESAASYDSLAEDFDGQISDLRSQDAVSLLPRTNLSIDECKVLMNEVSMDSSRSKERFASRDDVYVGNVLACAVQTGDVRLWMVPYYVRYVLEFIIRVGGLVAVGGIVYGGYFYMFGPVIDDKERGKKAVVYALAGIVLMSVAWAFVNIVISFLIS